MRQKSRIVLQWLLPLSLAGCARSCKDDHPYVPYAVGDRGDGADRADGSASNVPSNAAPEPFDAGATGGEPALAAPPGSRKWTADGLRLDAPDGKDLLFAIVRDVDGDGKKDALAIVRPSPAPGAKDWDVGSGEVVFYRGSGGPPLSIAVAPSARIDASCQPLARLSRIGPNSALAELGSTCAKLASSRELFVVRLAQTPTVAFELVIEDPTGAPQLAVDIDGVDRDHDGLDDVSLRVTIDGSSPSFDPGPRLSAKLLFLDRTGGVGRDAEEPEASLRAIAAMATTKAAKPKEATLVPPLVQQMRTLYRAMCVEGGAPRLLRRGGPISCGSSEPLETAGVAAVRALAQISQPLQAIAAAEIAQLPPAKKTAAKTAEIASILDKLVPFVQAKSARTLMITMPGAKTTQPAWGPLAFEPSGKLLVRGDGKVTRVDLVTYDDEEASGVSPWPVLVAAPDARSRWLEVYHACDGVAYHASFLATAGEPDIKDMVLPIAPPLGAKCNANNKGEPAATLPLAWSARGLEALVAGQPIVIRPETSQAVLLPTLLDELPALGSPRSPNGKVVAIITKSGVVVRVSNGRAVRYRAPELEPYDDLRQCTISDDATHLACNRRGKLVIATYDSP